MRLESIPLEAAKPLINGNSNQATVNGESKLTVNSDAKANGVPTNGVPSYNGDGKRTNNGDAKLPANGDIQLTVNGGATANGTAIQGMIIENNS